MSFEKHMFWDLQRQEKGDRVRVEPIIAFLLFLLSSSSCLLIFFLIFGNMVNKKADENSTLFSIVYFSCSICKTASEPSLPYLFPSI
jgi:hypothetical protein